MDKAIIILRVSSEHYSSEIEQEPECVQFVKDKGWILHKVFHELGSAYKKSFEEREVFQEALKEAKAYGVTHFIFWNMDRYSRLKPEIVLDYTKKLILFHNIKVHAVNGDNWSDLVETIGNIKDLGFMGEALSEFLEKIVKGFEHNRAYQESKVKSERVKLKVKKSDGKPTMSVYGNKWGKKSLPSQTISKVLELLDSGMSYRNISKEVWIYDKHGNKKKNISLGMISKILKRSQMVG